MKTLLTSMSIILLYSFAHAQAVISPKNWYKGVSTPLENNMFINLEDKQQFYLIANSVYIPFNISNDICSPASAKLTKIDVNGNVLATFQANGSVIDSYSMRGFYTSVITDQIIYFVSWENSKFQQYGSSKGFIIYHLNINSLKLLSTDTIKGIIPESMSIISWKSVDYGGYSFQAFTYQPFKGGSIKNKIIRIKLKTAGVEYVTLDLDSLMSQKQIGINNVSNVYLKNDSMVYTICGYDSNINNSEIYQLLRIDTSLKGFSYYNLEKENEFTYTFGRVAYMDYFPPTYELNNGKVVLGSQINTYDKMNGSRIDNAGMFYYDIKSKKPEKVLIIPNSTFTLSQISYAFFAPIAIKDSNIFCAAFDYYDYNTVYIDFRENHIYVGKTDTSLNGWHWYKYIGKP
ncbi:MAG: hypothetical protein JST52_12090, partial [Bacteroidetes bacterium]|nr:hypothetical protein [Bacteroidota bacterium]